MKLIFTNLLTAVITALLVSAFWVSAYGNRDGGGADATQDGKVETACYKLVLV